MSILSRLDSKNWRFKIIFGITGKDFIQNWILQNIANLDDISHILQPSWFKNISDYQFWIVEFCLGIHSAKFVCYSRTSASAGNVKLHLILCDKWEESKIVAVAWKVEPMQGLWLEWPVNNSFAIPDHTSNINSIPISLSTFQIKIGECKTWWGKCR